jgi:hypothetical protein
MNKDLIKGLLLIVATLGVMIGLFVLFADNGPAKAACVGRAIKSGISITNIDAVCSLTSRTR